MSKDKLNDIHCEPCQGGMSAMNAQMIASYMPSINQAWLHLDNRHCIERSFKFKNFSKTMFFVNALANLADQQGHHPDVKFGYNYCRVRFTTHEAGGLSLNDFICAKKVDLINE